MQTSLAYVPLPGKIKSRTNTVVQVIEAHKHSHHIKVEVFKKGCWFVFENTIDEKNDNQMAIDKF